MSRFDHTYHIKEGERPLFFYFELVPWISLQEKNANQRCNIIFFCSKINP